ncbi:Cyclic peptide transporter [Arthroderma uncinatum]|uniref:Cyclic peptide transporter n=1 Tax=Arthroderma uncinatum TaxID=74035 RepID=UPI00144AC7AD|nr:Cyclic peptide transporter [Arthroderma uncinatum]KAF3491610.1 Cyclic peptide transporter [Arthroderma uncinatum]
MPRPCTVRDENVFGPFIQPSCFNGFDFTLLFEENILTIVPSAIACLLLLFRVRKLQHVPVKVRPSWLSVVKLVAISLYLVLQLVLLILWAADGASRTVATVPATIVTIITFIFILYVSHLEHKRSLRPSTIINLYLGFSLLVDIARCRTIWLVIERLPIAVLFSVGCGIKVVILGLEATEKRSLLKDPYKDSAAEAIGGIYNRSVFWWVNNVLRKGFKNLLPISSLNVLDDDLLGAADPQVLIERWKNTDKSASHALLSSFLLHYKWHIAAGVIPRLACIGFSFAQPFLVQRVLEFIGESDSSISRYQGYGLIAAYAIVYVGHAISQAVYEHKTYRVITMVRGSLSTMIFQKTLRVECSATSDSIAITHLNADVEWVSSGLLDLHEFYSSILEASLALWLLARLLQMAMVASAVFILICLAAGIPLAIAAGNAHIQWLDAIGERISVTSKVLGSMKAIRMSGIATPVASGVETLRDEEIRSSRRSRFLDVLVLVMSYTSSTFAPVFGFGLYSILAKKNDTEPLTDSVAFSALTLFSLLEHPMGTLTQGGEHLVAIVKGFQRIQTYLREDERLDCRLISGLEPLLAIDTESKSPLQTTVSDSQGEEKVEEGGLGRYVTLQDVSGPFSEDTQPRINELSLEIDHNKITMIAGPVGCGKSILLKLLLGEIPYSGSLWISHTQAAYCSQAPWLASGSIRDNIVGTSQWNRPWYDEVMHTCTLDTDLHDMPEGDLTRVGVRGSRMSGGQQMRVALARALYSRAKVMILDDVLTGLDQVTAQHILKRLFGPDGMFKKNGQTVVLATSSVHHLEYADSIIILSSGGRLIEQGSYKDLVAKGCYSENLGRQSEVSGDDQAVEKPADEASLPPSPFDEEMVPERSHGDSTVYKFYFQNVGWVLLSFYIICTSAFIVGFSFPPIWLQWWTDANVNHPNERLGYWIGVYAGLSGLCLVLLGLCDWIFNMVIEPKTAKRFHSILLSTVMGATTAFLTSTDIGKTLNRFSQDLEIIDMELSSAFDMTMIAFLSCIAEGVLVFVGSSAYVGAAIPFCIFVVYGIQKIYLRTSRQIRLLEIEFMAPLQSQLLEVLSGLPSIRAYGWTEDYQERNKVLLNTSQQPYYLLFCLQRWLNLVLDLLVAGIAILVVSIATSLRGKASTGLLGVALFNIVNFSGSLQQLVAHWTKLEIAIGALSRIKIFIGKTPREDVNDETEPVEEDWPKEGAISLTNVSGSYGINEASVIEDINLEIRPGEKVAVCGRTGSGKSSLILALLRMLELKNGTILIDGVDISKVSRSDVRTRLNVVSQEPAFLHGSVRLNFDTTGEVEDDSNFIDALKAVGLWEHIESDGGLDAELSDDLFSHGERQLFCLARALCHSSSILIMDEATSSVDTGTDELVHSIINSRFQGKTVISIIHKLHNVLDFDKVVMMDKSRVVEFDSPGSLLTMEGSLFKRLYENGGLLEGN